MRTCTMDDEFRLYPSKEQERILLCWIGCQRLIYNSKVQEDRYFRKFQRRMVGLAGEKPPVDQQYRHFITEQTAFLRAVSSQVLRDSVLPLKIAALDIEVADKLISIPREIVPDMPD